MSNNDDSNKPNNVNNFPSGMVFRGVEQFERVVPENSNQPKQETSKQIKRVMQQLDKVDIESPEAKLNETTIKDSKGGRITLDDHVAGFKGVEPNQSKKSDK